MEVKYPNVKLKLPMKTNKSEHCTHMDKLKIDKDNFHILSYVLEVIADDEPAEQ